MAKGILEFELPEEDSEFDYARKGRCYSAAIFDLDQWLRNFTKHPPDDMPDAVHAAYEGVREQLRECMDDHGVSLDD